MSTQHTPGPWTYTHDGMSDFSLDAGDVNVIGGCGCCGSPSINSEADARLIAASPDLLESLKGLLYKDSGEPAFFKARAAIAKAEGHKT